MPLLQEVPARRTFGRVLLERRTEMELTQCDVSEELGFCDTMLGKIEMGKRLPDMKYLPALARILRIDLTLLVELYLRSKSYPVYAAIIRRFD